MIEGIVRNLGPDPVVVGEVLSADGQGMTCADPPALVGPLLQPTGTPVVQWSFERSISCADPGGDGGTVMVEVRVEAVGSDPNPGNDSMQRVPNVSP